MRVLLVGSLVSSTKEISDILSDNGWDVTNAPYGPDLFWAVKYENYDLIVMNWSVDDMESYEQIRSIRREQLDTPLMVVSDDILPEIKVQALTAGADDYLCRPYDTAELVARAYALMRRARGFNAGAMVRIGNVRVDLSRKVVLVNHEVLHLTGKEYAVMELLVLRRGIILSKEAFLEHLYSGVDQPEAKIIDVFVCKLRKKLFSAGADDIIVTIWGRGYMMRGQGTGGSPPRNWTQHGDERVFLS